MLRLRQGTRLQRLSVRFLGYERIPEAIEVLKQRVRAVFNRPHSSFFLRVFCECTRDLQATSDARIGGSHAG